MCFLLFELSENSVSLITRELFKISAPNPFLYSIIFCFNSLNSCLSTLFSICRRISLKLAFFERISLIVWSYPFINKFFYSKFFSIVLSLLDSRVNIFNLFIRVYASSALRYPLLLNSPFSILIFIYSTFFDNFSKFVLF